MPIPSLQEVPDNAQGYPAVTAGQLFEMQRETDPASVRRHCDLRALHGSDKGKIPCLKRAVIDNFLIPVERP